MEHYICKGSCKMVSETPGLCEDKSCPNYGKPLEACSCTDDMHYGAFKVKPVEGTDEDKEIPI